MAKTVERRPDGTPSPKEIGRQLRAVRRKQGLSRAEVARSAGLTRRELAAYERGRVDIPESDLWCLAGSCGVDVSELLPHRDQLVIDPSLSSLAIGDTIRYLRAPGEPDGLLREYLSMIYELRKLPPGSAIPLRAEDLSALADALGGSPDVIEQRLRELIGASGDEAARLRSMILPPLSLPPPVTDAPDAAVDASAPTATFAPPAAPNGDHPIAEQPNPDQAIALHPNGANGDRPGPSSDSVGLDDFFATPRAPDPFAPPPPPVPMDSAPPEPISFDAPFEPTPVAQDGTDTTTPEATMSMPAERPLPLDPFALPPDTSPVDVADALPMLRDDPFAPPSARTPVPDPVPADDGTFGDIPVDDVTVDDVTVDDVAPEDVVPDDLVPSVAVPPFDPGAFELPRRDGPADQLVAPHTVLDVPAGSVADDTSATPIIWRAPGHDEVEATEAALARHEDDVEARDVSAGPELVKAGAVWEVGGATPTPAIGDGGALALRRAENRWALCDLHVGSDFTAEAVVDFTAGTGFGILFRASVDEQEQISGYSFDVDAVSGGSGYVVRQWEANRPYWRPLAQAPVADPSTLFGRHTITLTVVDDALTVDVDGATVLTVPSLARASIELHQEPCRGDRLGIQAEATTDVTVDELAAASH